MAKLGWFVAGAVAMVGGPFAYAALGTARQPAPGPAPVLALEEADAAQQPLLSSPSLDSAPDAPTLTAAEFAPVTMVRAERPAGPTPVRSRLATEAARGPAPVAEARPAAAAKSQPQGVPVTSAVQSPAKPPVVAAGRPVPDGRMEAKPESKDAAAFMIAQISKVKRTLRLTPDQHEHWAALEATLRGIARQHTGRKADPSRPLGGIDLSEDDTNRLYWAAAPLIMSLRDDQKQDARQLARGMGLAQVASAF